MSDRHGDREPTPQGEPAPTITSKARTAEWVYVNGNQPNAARRGGHEPAPTVHFGAAMNDVKWETPDVETPRELHSRNGGYGAGFHREPGEPGEPAPTLTAAGLAKGRDVWKEPAPTITTTRRSKDGMLIGRQLPEGEGENVGGHNWTAERPSTAVCGDPRISPPGYRGSPEDYADGNPTRSGDNAIRVTVQEAAILQSFRPDYPWQGTKTKQHQQVGNAVPPLLAYAVLGQLVEPQERREAA